MTMVNMSPATTSPAMASEAPTNGNGHSGNAIINCISAWIVEFSCCEVDRLMAIFVNYYSRVAVPTWTELL